MIEFEKFEYISKDFTGICKITYTGTILHFKNGKRHNENGPAIILQDGTKCWYINNMRHREDSAAVEFSNGSKDWYYKGRYYGVNNDFTNETWIEFIENLKREEELKIFK